MAPETADNRAFPLSVTASHRITKQSSTYEKRLLRRAYALLAMTDCHTETKLVIANPRRGETISCPAWKDCRVSHSEAKQSSAA